MLKNIPMIGALFDSSRESITAAIKELFFSTVFSTLPIWFFPAIYAFFFKNSPPFLNNVHTNLIQGELYIYSSAIVGPLIFAITYNYATWGDKNPSPNASKIGKLAFAFPYGTWFFFISVIISMISVICFGFVRFASSGFIIAELEHESLLDVSIFLYLFSLISLFLVCVYKNELSNPTSGSDTDTRDFVEAWNARNA